MEIKRNIFIENKSVNALTKDLVFLNFYPTRFTLFSSVLAMNLKPFENEVRLSRKGEEIVFDGIEGKMPKDEVLSGNTLTPRSKAQSIMTTKRNRFSKTRSSRLSPVS
ncbi:hypothetical protein [Metallosphaera hakonensis]|uniref:hypothetical protein n=1 Tax=Metallosphaera hakonensis TaxID=79601 RepID=UPI000A70AFD6|nr:hypothetical protein [Metallosphaera hakonensis]